MGLSKFSTLFFLNSISLGQGQKKIGFALVSLVAAWATGALLSVALRGSMSPATPWTSITLPVSVLVLLYHIISLMNFAQFVRWLIVEVLGLVLEVCIWLFAVALIWPLHMQLSRRLKLLSLFGVRLLSVALTNDAETSLK